MTVATARSKLGPRILLAAIVLVLAGAVFLWVRTPPLEVEVGHVTRGAITVFIEDEGETRVRDLFALATPVAGRLERVEAEPGDAVAAGQVIARLRPVASAMLDPRSRAQATAEARALAATRAAFDQRVRDAEAALALAQRDFDRIAPLASRGFATRAALDFARAARDRAAAGLGTARASAVAARASEAAARATLADPSALPAPGMVPIAAPVAGRLLRRVEESERVLPAGTLIAEVGDPGRIEVVTDLLSRDAVTVVPGAAVLLDEWGREASLRGRVRRVEPHGFLKVSALGVEEQRVNVVIDITDPPQRRARLGHGYRLLVRIAVWSARDRLLVPVSALFRVRGRWALFTIEEGRARERIVAVERMNDRVAALTTPLPVGSAVILHPSEKIAPGQRVRRLESARSR